MHIQHKQCNLEYSAIISNTIMQNISYVFQNITTKKILKMKI